MGDIAAFLAMGGYAGFVWPAYGVTLVVLVALAVDSWRRYRQSTLALDRLQQRRRPRQ
jgi:heme exporter protein D